MAEMEPGNWERQTLENVFMHLTDGNGGFGAIA